MKRQAGNPGHCVIVQGEVIIIEALGDTLQVKEYSLGTGNQNKRQKLHPDLTTTTSKHQLLTNYQRFISGKPEIYLVKSEIIFMRKVTGIIKLNKRLESFLAIFYCIAVNTLVFCIGSRQHSFVLEHIRKGSQLD